MSRLKPRRADRAADAPDPQDAALRAELENRMDRLRAVIVAKRREGWIVVRAPALESGPDGPFPTT